MKRIYRRNINEINKKYRYTKTHASPFYSLHRHGSLLFSFLKSFSFTEKCTYFICTSTYQLVKLGYMLNITCLRDTLCNNWLVQESSNNYRLRRLSLFFTLILIYLLRTTTVFDSEIFYAIYSYIQQRVSDAKGWLLLFA